MVVVGANVRFALPASLIFSTRGKFCGAVNCPPKNIYARSSLSSLVNDEQPMEDQLNEVSRAALGAASTGQLGPARDPKEAAAFLGTSVPHLATLRVKGGGPKFTVISPRRVVYYEQHLLEWIAERTFAATFQYPTQSSMSRRGPRVEAA